MKIVLTEKQVMEILDNFKNKEMYEEDENNSSAYPIVGKWETGISRVGPANQIGLTKWTDIVGGKLVRGKANPLK